MLELVQTLENGGDLRKVKGIATENYTTHPIVQ